MRYWVRSAANVLFKGAYFPDHHISVVMGLVIVFDIGCVNSGVREYARGVSYPHRMKPRLYFPAHYGNSLQLEEFFLGWDRDFFRIAKKSFGSFLCGLRRLLFFLGR